MRKLYTTLSLLLGTATIGSSQYCTPSFPNGCFNWRTMSVVAGSINWSIGADDCTTSDYTSLSTTVDAGTSLPMSVTNGVWTGCAVWIDLDNSISFEDSENLYYVYVGADPSYQYDFSIAIPGGTPTGSYRMRIVSPWGSDGFLDTNVNGYGPCGSYQYGNYVDFTVNVIGSNGVAEVQGGTSLTLAPNPANDAITATSSNAIGQIDIVDAQGRVVVKQRVQGDRITIDTRSLSSGVYMVQLSTPDGVASQRLVIE